MVAFKLVIGLKDGKCVQKGLQEPQASVLVGKKIGDNIAGESIGLDGYEFKLTGGSDFCGFPMRPDVQGFNRKRILSIAGTIGVGGYYAKKRGGKVITKKIGKGIKIRKTVCGNTVSDKTAQVNLKVLKEGAQPIVHEPSKKE
ncbi:MAG: S6e family ribosomal protein [Nanoarchaeota archaeon]